MEIGKDIQRAAALLRAGGLVIMPTETSYGLAASATDPSALAALFRVKRREQTEPVGLFLHDMAQVEFHFLLSPEERHIAEHYWPGAVNMVLRPRSQSPLSGMLSQLAPGRPGISVRISSHPMMQELTAACGIPITSTSANRSGAGDVYAAEEIANIFLPDEVSYVFDGGVLPRTLPSTVIEWMHGALVIHRQGAVQVSHT